MATKPFRTTRRLVNLQQGRNDWYRISNLDGGPSQLHIYDEIGYFGITATDLVADLAGIKGDIEVHLNCPGGDIFEANTIFNALKQRKGDVAVSVDGLAASAASYIAQAATPGKLSIAKNASMMIHDAFSMGIGNAQDLRDFAELLDDQSDIIAECYADRSGKPAAHWRDLMRSETWFSGGQKAVDAGLADFVQGSEPAEPAAVTLAATWDLSIFAKRPGQPVAAATPVAAPPGGEPAEAEPGTGEPEPWDPDGNGDDDSTPEGDTDHSHWAPDGTQLKPVPGKPMTGPDGQPQYARADGIRNAGKYTQADRDRMAKSGQAMDDGSYPIVDAEDLDNAIHAVGRGGADHDAIRSHIIKRADALGLSSKIPGNWAADGSLKPDSETNHATTGFLALTEEMFANFRAALEERQ